MSDQGEKRFRPLVVERLWSGFFQVVVFDISMTLAIVFRIYRWSPKVRIFLAFHTMQLETYVATAIQCAFQ